jgi:outer membrane protein assembly factor BamB
MKKWKLWIISSVAVLLAACSQEHSGRTATYDGQQEQAIPAEKLLKNAPITKGTSLLPIEFTVKTDTARYIINMDGAVTVHSKKATLPLESGFYLVKLHYFNLDTILVLLADVEDGETGHTDVFSLNKNSLRVNWTKELSSYNASAGAEEQGRLYIGIKDYAYALDSKDGTVIWQVPGLYAKTGIMKYDSIAFQQGELVLFGKNKAESKPETIRINKTTGTM